MGIMIVWMCDFRLVIISCIIFAVKEGGDTAISVDFLNVFLWCFCYLHVAYHLIMMFSSLYSSIVPSTREYFMIFYRIMWLLMTSFSDIII